MTKQKMAWLLAGILFWGVALGLLTGSIGAALLVFLVITAVVVVIGSLVPKMKVEKPWFWFFVPIIGLLAGLPL